MARRVALFCEDVGHELFVEALVERLAEERHVRVVIQRRQVRGGKGRVVSELKAWQKTMTTGLATGVPDLLLLVIDTNCEGWNVCRNRLEKEIGRLCPSQIIGCPDPYIERWCFADPQAFQQVVGVSPPRDPDTCDASLYKDLLRRAFDEAGNQALTTPMEFAPDLVHQADLYAAGKNQPSLRALVDDLRGWFRSQAE